MKVLFVCLGNICRSPAAEAILKKKALERGLPLEVDSAAVGDWHIGQLPEARTRETGAARGYLLTGRAKLFQPEHLDQFDLILAADQSVLHALQSKADVGQKAKIHLMTHHAKANKDQEVPDPYYGGQAEFEQVFDLLEEACEGLLEHLSFRSTNP